MIVAAPEHPDQANAGIGDGLDGITLARRKYQPPARFAGSPALTRCRAHAQIIRAGTESINVERLPFRPGEPTIQHLQQATVKQKRAALRLHRHQSGLSCAFDLRVLRDVTEPGEVVEQHGIFASGAIEQQRWRDPEPPHRAPACREQQHHENDKAAEMAIHRRMIPSPSAPGHDAIRRDDAGAGKPVVESPTNTRRGRKVPMYQEIVYDVRDPVAVITMNRPDALNAFTNRMLAEIRHALAAAEQDPAVVGIVLTGAGRGFCAGMDMNALNAMSAGGGAREDLSALEANPGDASLGDNFQVAFTYLLSVRKPVIAAINGACAGLGFVFALLADMRFVEKQARFTTAFSQRGLIAEHGASWLLPRLIGSGKALDILWSGRKFDGVEADRLGLAERLLETGEACQAAVDYIADIARVASPTSLKVMKAQVYRHLNMQLGESVRESNDWMAESLARDDFKEGVRSFLEKRPPAFKRLSSD